MLEHRLEELRAELDRGHREMGLLDARRHELRDTLMRITGAVQVLEELIARDAGDGGAEPGLHGVEARTGTAA